MKYFLGGRGSEEAALCRVALCRDWGVSLLGCTDSATNSLVTSRLTTRTALCHLFTAILYIVLLATCSFGVRTCTSPRRLATVHTTPTETTTTTVS